MKQAILRDTSDVLHKLTDIEKEVVNLKLFLLKKLTPSGKKVVKLKGIIKGVSVIDEDIAAAKKSLYGRITP